MSYNETDLLAYADRECAEGISSVSAAIYEALTYMKRDPYSMAECMRMVNAIDVLSSEIDRFIDNNQSETPIYGDIYSLYGALNIHVANLMLHGVVARDALALANLDELGQGV
jgi:hypothetical protein